MSAQIVKEWIPLFSLGFRAEEGLHVESIILHHQQIVEDVNAMVLQNVELRQLAVLI